MTSGRVVILENSMLVLLIFEKSILPHSSISLPHWLMQLYEVIRTEYAREGVESFLYVYNEIIAKLNKLDQDEETSIFAMIY